MGKSGFKDMWFPLWICCCLNIQWKGVCGFGITSNIPVGRSLSNTIVRRDVKLFEAPPEKVGYTPPEESVAIGKKKEAPYPKIGDFVRYFDLDGGREDGQVLVGKITFFQKKKGEENGWLVELTELEDVGDGYFAEYPSRKRSSKQSIRRLEEIAPLSASFVRSENAYKIPKDPITLQPSPMFPQYQIEGFTGFQPSTTVDQDVVYRDGQTYNSLKFQLYKDAALYGLVGIILTDLFRGIEDALIYAAGAIAGVGYLFFLSVKTDTVGSAEAKMGSNISNLRFALPLLLLVGVSLSNVFSASPDTDFDMAVFRTVSKEQFAAAMIGFLTYRIPLFVSQLAPVIGDSATSLLPGSTGVALQMMQESKKSATNTLVNKDELLTILLVSGPQGTGKTTLVSRLISESKGSFIAPTFIDKIQDPATFEQLQRRDAFVDIDKSGRYGLTVDMIQKSAKAAASSDEENENSIVVIDSSVSVAKNLVEALPSDIRVVGVWVGLDTLDKFQGRLEAQVQSGDLLVAEDETPESAVRAQLRQIVKDIEYGVVSGVFEFTILNDDVEKSYAQLKEAANYCFK